MPNAPGVQLFALGPAFWFGGERALRTSSLDQTAWQRGISSAAAAFERPQSPGGLAQVVVGAAVGIPVGNLTQYAWWLQVLFGAAAAVVAYWAVPATWAAFVAVGAPTRQRNEVRRLLRDEREEHGREIAREQRRFDEMHESQRAAFDRKSLETEDLRGQLTRKLIGRRSSSLLARPTINARIVDVPKPASSLPIRV